MDRVVAIGDLHCGHVVGLTPPAYWTQYKPSLADLQKKMWDFYLEEIEKLKPIKWLFVNGDAIDGRGEKSGGTELIMTDRMEQVQMAYECLKVAEADNVVLSYGTPYHTGQIEDFERDLAEKIGGTIEDNPLIDVNGVLFDLRHKIGSSSVPYGRSTQGAKADMWNLLWSEEGSTERADVFLRSHVHYHEYSGNPDRLRMTLPALQGPGSKFGKRQCDGLVHVGLVHFDVDTNGGYEWKSKVLKAVAKRQVLGR